MPSSHPTMELPGEHPHPQSCRVGRRGLHNMPLPHPRVLGKNSQSSLPLLDAKEVKIKLDHMFSSTYT